jgi:hypothetical protein
MEPNKLPAEGAGEGGLNAQSEKTDPRLFPAVAAADAADSGKSDSPELVQVPAGSSTVSADEEVSGNRRQKLERIGRAIKSGYYDADEFLDRALIRMLEQLENDP